MLDSAIIANPALVKLTTSTKRNGRRRFKHCPLNPAQIATLASYIANDQHNPIYGLVVTFDGVTGLRLLR